ncbi:MAG: barstar family protein [Clostridia bacterium]|nr:barstar family protein [Clostridia bacterium]
MENMKITTLDLTDCKYIMDLHERIRIAFDFPECYGANWHAFWDFLWSNTDVNKAIIIGANTMPRELQPSVEHMKKILERMKLHCEKYDDFFDYEFVDA